MRNVERCLCDAQEGSIPDFIHIAKWDYKRLTDFLCSRRDKESTKIWRRAIREIQLKSHMWLLKKKKCNFCTLMLEASETWQGFVKAGYRKMIQEQHNHNGVTTTPGTSVISFR